MDPVMEALNQRVDGLESQLKALRQFAPPVAVKRARRIRLVFELVGIGLVATGLGLIYAPLSLLFVGAWLATDAVLSSHRERRQEQKR